MCDMIYSLPEDILIDKVLSFLCVMDFMMLERSVPQLMRNIFKKRLIPKLRVGFQCLSNVSANEPFMNWIVAEMVPLGAFEPSQENFFHINSKLVNSLTFNESNSNHVCVQFYVMKCPALEELVIRSSYSLTSQLFQSISRCVLEKIKVIRISDCPCLDGGTTEIIAQYCRALVKLELIIKGYKVMPSHLSKLLVSNAHTLREITLTLCITHATAADVIDPSHDVATYRQCAARKNFGLVLKHIFACKVLDSCLLNLYHDFSVDDIIPHFEEKHLQHLDFFLVTSRCSDSCTCFGYAGLHLRKLNIAFASHYKNSAASVCNLVPWMMKTFTRVPFHLSILDDCMHFPWPAYHSLVTKCKTIRYLELIVPNADRADLMEVFGCVAFPHIDILMLSNEELMSSDVVYIIELNLPTLLGFPLTGLPSAEERIIVGTLKWLRERGRSAKDLSEDEELLVFPFLHDPHEHSLRF